MTERLWLPEWPDEVGAWWFYGKLPNETAKTLIITIVNKTANVPPQYFVFWNMNFWTEGQIEGKWLKIDMPKLPED